MIAYQADFPITIVSTDTTALREISWALAAFGYRATASSDWSDHAPWRRIGTPSVLLLDARDEETQLLLSAERTEPYVYRIVFYDAALPAGSERLTDMGAEDLVQFPLNMGEIFSRLKSAGRRLEFERRFCSAMTFDQEVGMANRRGLIRQLDRKLLNAQDTDEGAFIILGIDFLDELRSQYGSLAVDESTLNLAKLLHEELASEDLRGAIQEGVFAVLLAGRTVSEGQSFAKNISILLAAQDVTADTARPQISVSSVVLDWPAGDTGADAVTRGLTALEHARGYGGNQILTADKLEQDHSEWTQNFQPFHEIRAEHVMESLPLVLPANGSMSADCGGSSTHAFISNQPVPPCVPVVDEGGSLVGVVEEDSWHQHGGGVFQSVDEYLVGVSELADASISFDDLVESASASERDYLVVVDNQRPIGYVTTQSLAAVKIDPVDAIYDPSLQYADEGLDTLVVPVQ